MPAGAIYVGRPGTWGNPYVVGSTNALGEPPIDEAEAVARYRAFLEANAAASLALLLAPLRGRDLACWCRLDQPCHADVLLELANG